MVRADVGTAAMINASERLWRINQEYVRRLAMARNTLSLLASLLETRWTDDDGRTRADARRTAPLRALLRDADATLSALHDEHRAWRYRYLYESPDSKRIVQDNTAIELALAWFAYMRQVHEAALDAICSMLATLARPDPAFTTVAQGDLWALFAAAVDNVRHFELFIESI
ncbi:MAG: hypothetical protein SGI73_00195 [Chloroflexota bacterium]|nr:hypothetical protein [Chloroflexota bacterium]